MKKILAFTGIIMAALLIVAVVNPLAGPMPANITPGLAGGGSGGGSVYITENRDYCSFIYGVSRQGTVTSVYREPGSGLKKGITICHTVYLQDKLYFIRASAIDAYGELGAWELISLDLAGSERKALYMRGGNGPIPVLAASGNSIFLCFREQDGSAVGLYELNPAAQRPELKLVMATEAPAGATIQAAAYDGARLWCALADGRVIYQEQQPAGFRTALSGGGPHALASADGNTIFADNFGGAVYYGAGGALTQADFPAWMSSVRAAIASGQNEFVVLAERSGGKTALSWHDGTGFSPPLTPRALPVQRIMFAVALLYTPVGWLAAAVALMVILLGTAALTEKFITRLVSISAVVILVLATAIISLSFSSAGAHIRDDRAAELQSRAAQYAAELKKAAVFAAAEEDAARLLAALFEPDAGLQQYSHVSIDILAVAAAEAVVYASYRLPQNTTYQQGFENAVAAAVAQVLQSGVATSVESSSSGLRMLAHISLVGRAGGQEYVLVAASSMSAAYAALNTLLIRLVLYAGAMGLAALLIMSGVAVMFMRPLWQLRSNIDDIIFGRFEDDGLRPSRGEIGELQRAIKEMRVSLSIEEYRNRSTLSAYYRFVPRGLERLLSRANIAEIECGDAETLSGYVGVVTVRNREQARIMASDRLFMDFVNEAFRHIYNAAAERDAIFLSDNFKLSGFHLVFPQGAQEGVRFGLSLMGSDDANNNTEASAPEYSVLLHPAKYFYGVAGVEDMAFTFISSSELDFLTELAPRFVGLGVRLLMTEQYFKAVGSRFSSRYIGFVSSPDGRHTFKLYEVLDVYPAVERQRRAQYDHRFQEGLNFYYKNDFYLARNVFSSLCKESPADDMARWYLFACEHLFNVPELDKINYGIFGTDED